MRPLIPAALLLAYACGSSNPEPVSAPTPADSAALARATPHALIAAREPYYDIDGSSAGAVRNAREVMAALTTLRGTNCNKLLGDASNTVERIVADGRARNRAYDVQTQHGQTQGVELGP